MNVIEIVSRREQCHALGKGCLRERLIESCQRDVLPLRQLEIGGVVEGKTMALGEGEDGAFIR